MHLDYFLEQLSSFGQLHHNVHISIVNISLMKLDNIGMVNLSQYPELFLQQLDIFLYVFFEDAFYCIFDLGISNPVCDAHRAEVTSTD